jgi:hypothetical protein
MNGRKLDGQRVLQSRTIAQILSDQDVPLSESQARTTHHGLTWLGYDGLGPGFAWAIQAAREIAQRVLA